MNRLRGAYSLTLLTKDTLFAVRGSLGVRPLCLGSIDGGWVIASETCALDHIGANFIREVEPGEIIKIDGNGVESRVIPVRAINGHCASSSLFILPVPIA